MQKNTNRVIETVVISNPEAALEGGNFTYQSAELQEIIQNFNSAANFRDIHKYVIDLLQAVANFRYASVPNGIFFELRNKSKSDKELNDLFIKLDQAFIIAENHWQQAKLAKADKIVLDHAIRYAYHATIERINSLKPADRLLPLWSQSSLKAKSNAWLK